MTITLNDLTRMTSSLDNAIRILKDENRALKTENAKLRVHVKRNERTGGNYGIECCDCGSSMELHYNDCPIFTPEGEVK